MLRAKNFNGRFFLNQNSPLAGWKSPADLTNKIIFPDTAGNADAGIVIDEAGKVGVAYYTASGRFIFSFADEVILVGMDESEFFREELEEFFDTEFFEVPKKEALKKRFRCFFVRRPEEYADGEFVPLNKEDCEWNKEIIKLFNELTKGEEVIPLHYDNLPFSFQPITIDGEGESCYLEKNLAG